MLSWNKETNKYRVEFEINKLFLGSAVFIGFIFCAFVVLLFVSKLKEAQRLATIAKKKTASLQIGTSINKKCISDPCTVSPAKELKSTFQNDIEPLYPDADFSSLDEALRVVEEENLDGAKLILLAGEDRLSSSHIVVANTDPNSEPIQITKSIHLIGEKVSELYKMPRIELYEKYEFTDPNGTTRQYLRRSNGINNRSFIGFYDSGSSSVENIYFDQRISMYFNQPQQYYEDIDNMLSVFKIIDSEVDIRNCYFLSHWNTDVNEIIMPVSWDQVRKNRIAAAIYVNSKGQFYHNAVIGHWSGGVLAKQGSTVNIMANQMVGDWFSVAGRQSNIQMYNNSIYVIDGRRYMGSPAGNWTGLQAEYPDWIGPIPISDYPLIGVWMAEGSLKMKQNTLGEHSVSVKLENVSSSEIANNVFVHGVSGGIVKDSTSEAEIIDNLNLLSKADIHTNFDMSICGGAMDSGASGLPICFTTPKKESQVVTNLAGYTFGEYTDLWNNWRFLHRQKGCGTVVQEYFPGYLCAEGLKCADQAHQCIYFGEDPDPSGPTQLPTNIPRPQR